MPPVCTRVAVELPRNGGKVVVYDLRAIRNAPGLFGERIAYAFSIRERVSGADCAVVRIEWAEFTDGNA